MYQGTFFCTSDSENLLTETFQQLLCEGSQLTSEGIKDEKRPDAILALNLPIYFGPGCLSSCARYFFVLLVLD